MTKAYLRLLRNMSIMISNLFINLPVSDLAASIGFFKSLGFDFNEQFSDDTAACMILSHNMCVMLLTHEKFKLFTPKEVADSKKSTEVLLAMSVDQKEKVDAIADKAIAAGGQETRPSQDHGFMYGRSFSDLDGHIWEVLWMQAPQNN